MGSCCTMRTTNSLSPLTILNVKELEHMERPSLSFSRLPISTQTAFGVDENDTRRKISRSPSRLRTSLDTIAIERPHKLSIDSLKLGERGLLLEKRDSSLSNKSSFTSNIAIGSRTSLLLSDPVPENAVLRFSRFMQQSLVHQEASDESSVFQISEESQESEEKKENLADNRLSRKSHTASFSSLKPVLKRFSNVSVEDRVEKDFGKKRVRFFDCASHI